MSHPFDKFLHCLIWWKDVGSCGSATKKNTIIDSSLPRLYDILKGVFKKESPGSQKTRGKKRENLSEIYFLGFSCNRWAKISSCSPTRWMFAMPNVRLRGWSVDFLSALHQVFHISWDGFSSWEQFRSWDIDCHSPWVLGSLSWSDKVPECPD